MKNINYKQENTQNSYISESDLKSIYISERDPGYNIISVPDNLVAYERITSGLEQYDYVKCSLCLRVSLDLDFLECCSSIICKFCTKMLKNVHFKNCPLCSKDYPVISSPNRFIFRILDAIRCACKFLNCENSNLTLNELKTHEKFCKNNPNGIIKCETCQGDFEKLYEKDHDCKVNLVNQVKILTEKTKILNSHKYIDFSNKLISDLAHSGL